MKTILAISLMLLMGCDNELVSKLENDNSSLKFQIRIYSEQLKSAGHELMLERYKYGQLQESKCSNHFQHVDGKLYKRIK